MSVTRRDFIVAVPAAGAALALAPLVRSPQSPGGLEAGSVASTVSSTLSASRPPVVSFHLDQPYIDHTGLEKPYVPPVGMRSGASLASLTEEQLLSRYYGFI